MASQSELGLQAFKRGEHEKAEEHFSEAIESEPDSESFYFRGVIRELIGKDKLAIEDLSHAIKLAPEDARYRQRQVRSQRHYATNHLHLT